MPHQSHKSKNNEYTLECQSLNLLKICTHNMTYACEVIKKYFERWPKQEKDN